MTYILRFDTSPRSTESVSRNLANKVEQHLLELDKKLFVKTRNLSTVGLPHISNDTITGFYTPTEDMTTELKEATTLSNELIHELKAADTLLISSPMYNFGIPSSLKAWVDQIVRINQTFSFDSSSFEGLVPVKRAVLVLAYGAERLCPQWRFCSNEFPRTLSHFSIGISRYPRHSSHSYRRYNRATRDVD